MKSFDQNKELEHGRAIARGMDEIQTRKEINKAREQKRMKTMLHNAAEKELFK